MILDLANKVHKESVQSEQAAVNYEFYSIKLDLQMAATCLTIWQNI